MSDFGSRHRKMEETIWSYTRHLQMLVWHYMRLKKKYWEKQANKLSREHNALLWMGSHKKICLFLHLTLWIIIKLDDLFIIDWMITAIIIDDHRSRHRQVSILASEPFEITFFETPIVLMALCVVQVLHLQGDMMMATVDREFFLFFHKVMAVEFKWMCWLCVFLYSQSLSETLTAVLHS